MAQGTVGWMISTEIDVSQIRAELKQRLANLRRTRTLLRKKGLVQNSKMLDDQITMTEELVASIRADYRTRLGRTFKQHADVVTNNVESRFVQRFPEGSDRLTKAMANSKFSTFKAFPDKDILFYGIGNIDVLDRETTLFADGYEPPGSYRNPSWWRFFEFTGIGPPQNFKSEFTRAYVEKRGWLNRVHIDTRSFMLLRFELFKEDKEVFDGMQRAIATRLFYPILRRARR